MDRISSTFSTAYFPPISYLRAYFSNKNRAIEIHESFPKQTLRNRCEILSSNGIQRLSVPVKKINGSKTLTKDIEIDHNNTWKKDHWRAIQSAYASAPYFEDYALKVNELIYDSPKQLIELNEEIMNFIHDILDLPHQYNHSQSYKKSPAIDHRATNFMNRESILSYQQVFAYDNEFKSNLSILDLIFNEGPFIRNWILNE